MEEVKKRRVEYFINGKRFELSNVQSMYDILLKHERMFYQKGYLKLDYIPGHHPTDDELWFINPVTFKVICYNYRIFTGFIDSEGHLIYEKDGIDTGSFKSGFYHYFSEGYYIRECLGYGSWRDTSIKTLMDSKRLKKIDDKVFGKDQTKWDFWKIPAITKEEF